MAHDFLQLVDQLDQQAHYHIADKIEDRYGENPCKQLVLENEDGERLELVCNRKHCEDCGPRKAYLNELQIIEAFGDIGWVGRMDRAEVDRALEAAKKRKQRNGEQFTYMVVGSERLSEYIFMSDTQLSPDQRRMDLTDWHERIRHMYTYGTRRRCSRSVSSMSLVRKTKGTTNKGHHQPTWRRVVESAGHAWLDVKEQIHQQHVRMREESEVAWDKKLTFVKYEQRQKSRESEQLSLV